MLMAVRVQTWLRALKEVNKFNIQALDDVLEGSIAGLSRNQQGRHGRDLRCGDAADWIGWLGSLQVMACSDSESVSDPESVNEASVQCPNAGKLFLLLGEVDCNGQAVPGCPRRRAGGQGAGDEAESSESHGPFLYDIVLLRGRKQSQ